MADWTELLPEGVERPIVIEIRHPKALRATQSREFEEKIRQGMESLVNDPEYIESYDRMLGELGADHLTLLAVPIQEQWTASEEGGEGEKTEGELVGGRGRRQGKRRIRRIVRRPGPEGRDISITVHLPNSVASTREDEESATETIMDWFESSKLGQIYLRAFREAGVAHVGAVGRLYARKGGRGWSGIRGVQRREDVGQNFEIRKRPM